MSTFLFDKIVFGPVQSRRLGVSLGINLLPPDGKVCTFDCIYCECGWTDKGEKVGILPKQEDVISKLESVLTDRMQNNLPIDAITFAGNGEPTMHPKFAEIIDQTIKLKQRFYPNARISVLSNATMITKPKVFNALLKVDDNILKLDSAVEETIRKINCPLGDFHLPELMEGLERFEGNLVIQTMFIRGEYDGQKIDNTTEEELLRWLDALSVIRPKQVMVYSIARDTAAENIEKVPLKELETIAKRVKALGIDVRVSG
ncbi:MAG: radical SAM protein [Salinivirgaceae bacterium]|jgi:wyosine [tRNA(Phe)-imidazoG37] synthetase (radical SAM superfamily)|nr:radical SAM protein [Salinivirgaceae bacterium]